MNLSLALVLVVLSQRVPLPPPGGPPPNAIGGISDYAGLATYPGPTDGLRFLVSRLDTPRAITTNAQGQSWVLTRGTDPDTSVVRFISGDSVYTWSTIAQPLNELGDLVVDSGGALFFTNTVRNAVYRIDHYGSPADLWVGLPIGMQCFPGYQPPCFEWGDADGDQNRARFFGPVGLAIDTNGDLLVADEGNHTIRRVTPNRFVTKLFPSVPGFFPEKLVVDAPRNRLVVINGELAIDAVTSTGQITRIAGLSNGQGGVVVDGDASVARFGHASSVAVDAAGNIFVADSYVTGAFTWVGVIRHVVPGQTFRWGSYPTTVRTLPLTPAQMSIGQGFTWTSDAVLGAHLALSWLNGSTLAVSDPTRHTVRLVIWGFP